MKKYFASISHFYLWECQETNCHIIIYSAEFCRVRTPLGILSHRIRTSVLSSISNHPSFLTMHFLGDPGDSSSGWARAMHKQTQLESQSPSSVQPSPGCYRHVGSKGVKGRDFLSISLTFPSFPLSLNPALCLSNT